jgi:hypothetical protein
VGRFALRHSSTAGAIAEPINSGTTNATSRNSRRSSPRRRQVELIGIDPTLLAVQEPSPDEVEQRSREASAAEPSRRKGVRAPGHPSVAILTFRDLHAPGPTKGH